MASAPPIAVGTRGTIGTLVKKEIEYFTKLDLDPAKPRRCGSPQHVHDHQAISWSSFKFLGLTWKKKKHRPASTLMNSFLPSLCSFGGDVAHMNRLNGIPGFGYKPLRHDHIKYNNI